MQRRDFLRGSVMAGTALAFSHRRLWAQSSDAHIEILVNEPVGVISPNIYGHFTEHIGGVIYDGVWVGRNSSIPNVDGIRKQFVDDMKRIGAPNLRPKNDDQIVLASDLITETTQCGRGRLARVAAT